MDRASRQVHQRVVVVAAAGISLVSLSQAHLFAASQYRLPVETALAAVADSASGPGNAEARHISVRNSIDIDRSHSLERHTLIIAAVAGYGIDDCLGEGGECGRVVAEAWCEIDGHGAALKFGQAGEDFDVISKVSSSAPGRYFVTCGD